LITRIKAFFIQESFRPGLIGLFTNPFYAARKGLYQNIAATAHLVQGRVLDVGCGQKPYEKLFNSSEYIGLELDTLNNRRSKKADYFYDGHTFPFENASFDTVIINQVLEHVFNPDEFMRQMNRILRLQGGLLLTVPFIWDEHEQPYDYARYSSFGLRHLLEKHGFKIVEQRKSIADVRVIFQIINCYLHNMVANWNIYFKLPAWIVLTSPFNILGEVLYRLLPANQDLYLDNIVFARKERDNE